MSNPAPDYTNPIPADPSATETAASLNAQFMAGEKRIGENHDHA